MIEMQHRLNYILPLMACRQLKFVSKMEKLAEVAARGDKLISVT